MKGRLLRLVTRPLALGIVLGAILLFAVFQCTRIWDTRREWAQVERQTRDLQTEIAVLTDQLTEERAGRGLRLSRGRGPGGIFSPWENYLFHGPTAAQSALDVAEAADEAPFRRFRYFGEDVVVLSTFPPGSGEDDEEQMVSANALPVRDQTDFVEWPLELNLEADYASLLDMVERLTFAEPSFAVHDVQFEVFRDEKGRVADRLTLTVNLSTFWLRGGRS